MLLCEQHLVKARIQIQIQMHCFCKLLTLGCCDAQSSGLPKELHTCGINQSNFSAARCCHKCCDGLVPVPWSEWFKTVTHTHGNPNYHRDSWASGNHILRMFSMRLKCPKSNCFTQHKTVLEVIVEKWLHKTFCLCSKDCHNRLNNSGNKKIFCHHL